MARQRIWRLCQDSDQYQVADLHSLKGHIPGGVSRGWRVLPLEEDHRCHLSPVERCSHDQYHVESQTLETHLESAWLIPPARV